jgi:hypothetical protein
MYCSAPSESGFRPTAASADQTGDILMKCRAWCVRSAVRTAVRATVEGLRLHEVARVLGGRRRAGGRLGVAQVVHEQAGHHRRHRLLREEKEGTLVQTETHHDCGAPRVAAAAPTVCYSLFTILLKRHERLEVAHSVHRGGDRLRRTGGHTARVRRGVLAPRCCAMARARLRVLVVAPDDRRRAGRRRHVARDEDAVAVPREQRAPRLQRSEWQAIWQRPLSIASRAPPARRDRPCGRAHACSCRAHAALMPPCCGAGGACSVLASA